MNPSQSAPIRFENVEVFPARRQLFVAGQAAALGARAFDLLLVLLENRERVLGKDELLARVWPDGVEENNLTVQISALRKLMGPEAIITVPGRGYQFALGGVPERPSPALADKPSIAVLPFTNMSGDAAQDYFADGVVEDITTALARLNMFFVIARNSSFVYKNRAVDIRQVGRELGVQYVLEGSVRKVGNGLRITGQLIETHSAHHVWADRFDGDVQDVFVLQDQITDNIVRALQPQVRRSEVQRVRGAPAPNPQAYDLCLQALPKLYPGAGKQALDEAMALAQRALRIDPQFARAKTLAATACMTRIFDGTGAASDIRSGLRYAEEALAITDDDPLVLSLSGLALGVLGFRALGLRLAGFRYAEALRAVERALSIGPNLMDVHYCAGTLKPFMGQGDAALAHFEQAMRISPLDPFMGNMLCGISGAHLVSGRYPEALAAAQTALQRSPKLALAHRLALVALGFLGRMDEAKRLVPGFMQLAPTFTVRKYLCVVPYQNADMRNQVAKIYRAVGVPR
jgi:TolB-like protein/tetratricopeptide (TPR) repeat protein